MKCTNDSKGFSLPELLVALTILAVLTAISLPYLASYKKLYKSEDQALKVIDLMGEASQLALTRRRTFRLEIDTTDNAVLIIDEAGGSPDVLVKKIPMEKAADIRMDRIPAGVSKPNPPNYTDISFVTDATGHYENGTQVTGHTVWAARFRSDGSVVNASNALTSVNVYIWPPITPGSLTPRNRSEVRAITLFGGSGAIRYWKHNGTTFVAK